MSHPRGPPLAENFVVASFAVLSLEANVAHVLETTKMFSTGTTLAQCFQQHHIATCPTL